MIHRYLSEVEVHGPLHPSEWNIGLIGTSLEKTKKNKYKCLQNQRIFVFLYFWRTGTNQVTASLMRTWKNVNFNFEGVTSFIVGISSYFQELVYHRQLNKLIHSRTRHKIELFLMKLETQVWVQFRKQHCLQVLIFINNS